jgi:allantoinase
MKAGEWTLRSRRVVTPSGTRPADVLIHNETIADLLEYDGPEAEGVILDAGDLAVLPGLVALHREAPEDLDERWFEAATRDCGAGGVTTLIDLPARFDDESADGSSLSLRRMAAAEGKIRVDCGLIVPLRRGEVDRIESWIEAGFLAVEAVLEDWGRDDAWQADIRAAMLILCGLGRPLIVDLGRIARPIREEPAEPDRFASSLPEREFAAIRLLIRLCRETHCRVHLIHPSASEALPMLAEARAEGLPLTVETCPRHLGFAAAEVVNGVPTFPLDPGRRGLDARSRLWDALESGLIGAIGPGLTRSAGAASRAQCGGVGLAQLETGSLRLALPVVWASARRRGLTLDHLGRWMAGGTAKVLGLSGRKGAIAPGLDADLVVFDPDAHPFDRQGLTPAPEAGLLAGLVEATILRGTMIYQAGQFFEHPRGSVVLRLEETQPIQGTDV